MRFSKKGQKKTKGKFWFSLKMKGGLVESARQEVAGALVVFEFKLLIKSFASISMSLLLFVHPLACSARSSFLMRTLIPCRSSSSSSLANFQTNSSSCCSIVPDGTCPRAWLCRKTSASCLCLPTAHSSNRSSIFGKNCARRNWPTLPLTPLT